jgi:glutamate dehydrogenase/leucine dehydrogenase
MSLSKNLINLKPNEFINFLKKEGITRFFFSYDPETKKLKSSHAQLEEAAAYIQSDKRDFAEHEGLFFEVNDQYDILQGAFIHRTCRGQGAGGVRFWEYPTVADFLQDGLRLSKGMTHKNALAGLWWGGGKGIITVNPAIDKNDLQIREAVFKAYGKFITSLKGCYITAEDVGASVDDMTYIFSQTRFITCIPHTVGGSGNPSGWTARGVVSGMEAALQFLGEQSLHGKIIVVQGMGHVGEPLIQHLFEKKVAKVIACDTDGLIVNDVKGKFKDKPLFATIVARGDNSILGEACDILAPCATGAILNPDTIPRIKARIICGAANNQLEDSDRDDQLLFERKILYVPDFLTNRMGIVNCANEQYGYVDHDPFIQRHLSRDWVHSVYQTTLQVLEGSRKHREAPGKVALRIADELSYELHPIFGHRGRQIIDSLIAADWHLMGG